ncbi:MAG: hypothetical protein P8Y00_02560 [Deltaproteobacteria bacterium]
MSHLGLKILYQILNARPWLAAERVFSPWSDLEQALRSSGICQVLFLVPNPPPKWKRLKVVEREGGFFPRPPLLHLKRWRFHQDDRVFFVFMDKGRRSSWSPGIPSPAGLSTLENLSPCHLGENACRSSPYPEGAGTNPAILARIRNSHP